MRFWRLELLTATQALDAVQTEMAGATGNPILRLGPVAQTQIEAIAPRLAAARERLQLAHTTLVDALPKSARAAQVPPAWLL